MVTRPNPQDAGEQAAWWRHPAAAGWLHAEAEASAKLLGSLRGRQAVELAPSGMPPLSLAEPGVIPFAQDGDYWCHPVYAHLAQLPVVAHSLDVVIWRYLDLSAFERTLLMTEIHRCLRPGGQLLMVSLNPLQPACWRACELRQLGRQALDLTWPMHLRGFRTQTSRMAGGARLLRPVRLLLLRKNGDPRAIRPLQDSMLKSVKHRSPQTLPSCRAA